MSTAAFHTTAVPLTAPLRAAPRDDVHAILRPFILIGAVAFMIGFGGYVALKAPHAVIAPEAASPAAVSLPAAMPLPDASNPPQPV